MCLKELEKYYRKMCFFYNNHSNSLLLMKLDLKKKKKIKSQGTFFRRRMCESLRLQKVNWAFCLRIRGQKVTHCFLAYPSESPCVFNTFSAHTKLHCSKPWESWINRGSYSIRITLTSFNFTRISSSQYTGIERNGSNHSSSWGMFHIPIFPT